MDHDYYIGQGQTLPAASVPVSPIICITDSATTALKRFSVAPTLPVVTVSPHSPPQPFSAAASSTSLALPTTVALAATSSMHTHLDSIQEAMIEKIRSKVEPFPLQSPTEWQESFSINERFTVVFKIVTCLTPPMPLVKYLEESTIRIMDYARDLEFKTFQSSSSERDYYKSLAEKLFRLNTEHNMRKKQETRKSELQSYQRHLNIPARVRYVQQVSPQKRVSNILKQSPQPQANDELHLPYRCQNEVGRKRPAMSESSGEEFDPKKFKSNGILVTDLSDSELGINILQPFVKLENIQPVIPRKIGEDFSQNRQHLSMENGRVDMNWRFNSPHDITLASSVFRNPAQKQHRIGKNPMVSVESLKTILIRPLLKLFAQPDAQLFKEPVDAKLQRVPDYFKIIKNPMDLSKVRDKLSRDTYKEPWAFIEDVHKIFENAMIYNKKKTKAYRCANALATTFNREMQPLMVSLGYCCGSHQRFHPTPITCLGKDFCQIGKHDKYYSYQDKYFYCDKCFNTIKSTVVELTDAEDGSKPPEEHVSKSKFDFKVNDETEIEPFVSCTSCDRKFHNICVLHLDSISPQGFVCDNCLEVNGTVRSANKFTADNLSKTELGSFIESRVNNFLKANDTRVTNVVVRVVSSYLKTVQTQPVANRRYVSTGQISESFPSKVKSILAFQDQVCFFGMQVQEYGSECPLPNTRRVYIAYLDSVNFFRPREFRTSVYQEIMLGYLEFVKRLGYRTAHLWACPPRPGDDYIFYCHPADQKFPNAKRLHTWYTTLLEKAVSEEVALNFKNILDYAMEEKISYPTELPYFEGDFFVNVLEEEILEFEKEEEAKKQPGYKNKFDDSPNKKQKRLLPVSVLNGDEIAAKVLWTLNKHKDLFFVITLHSAESAVTLGPIVDPDPLIDCDLMQGRDRFLALAREKNYEFSSVRRAKYSTMATLYEIHTNASSIVITCNSCNSVIDAANVTFHCNRCPDLDLCRSCLLLKGHQHHDTVNEGRNANNVVFQQIEQNLVTITHAFNCEIVNCIYPRCSQFKIMYKDHVNSCSQKLTHKCPTCKTVWSLLCVHALVLCKTYNNCNVPLCRLIKKAYRRRNGSTEQSLKDLRRK